MPTRTMAVVAVAALGFAAPMAAADAARAHSASFGGCDDMDPGGLSDAETVRTNSHQIRSRSADIPGIGPAAVR